MDYYPIYDRPSDYPNNVCVRRFSIGPKGEVKASDNVSLFDTIEEARKFCEDKGLYQFSRSKHDDPVLVETWL